MNKIEVKIIVEGITELTEAINCLAGHCHAKHAAGAAAPAGIPSTQPVNPPAAQQAAPMMPPQTAQQAVPMAHPVNPPAGQQAVHMMPPQTANQLPAQPGQAGSVGQPVVPTTANVQGYTIEQLQVAAAGLMSAGKGPQVMGILQQFGIQAMTELPKERYGEFATMLRGVGAQI